MSRVRRPVPRKGPARKVAVGTWDVATPNDVAAVDDTHAQDDQHEILKQRAIDEFESSLRGQDGMDEEGMQLLLDAFRAAVNEAPMDVSFTPLGPEEVARTLNGLVDEGVLQEDERNALARQFESALDPLEDEKVRIALEFAQRVERDGEAEARKWLEAQQEASSDGAGQQPLDSSATPHSGQAITKSRSRRLRGPPAR